MENTKPYFENGLALGGGCDGEFDAMSNVCTVATTSQQEDQQKGKRIKPHILPPSRRIPLAAADDIDCSGLYDLVALPLMILFNELIDSFLQVVACATRSSTFQKSSSYTDQRISLGRIDTDALRAQPECYDN
ncbi:hypothetical protein AKJ16_DCAP15652 [Drosera capensis]